MKLKRWRTVAALSLLCLTDGCETYRKQAWTPESFNYTLQRDRTTGELSDYFGLSWNLKPEVKP